MVVQRVPQILGLTQSGFDPASRFRWMQFMPYLEEAGWKVDHRPNRPDRQWHSPFSNQVARACHYRWGRLAQKFNRWRDVNSAGAFDVVFVNRDLAGPGRFLEQRLLAQNRRVIFDFDDAIFVGRNEQAVAWMCSQCAWVTPGNEYLASFARRYSDRVTILPTVIDTGAHEPKQHGHQDGNRRVRVGWSGSDQSIAATLTPRLPMLAQLQSRVPFELVVITNTKPKIAQTGLIWTFHPWKANEESALAAKLEIGIMPLQSDKFQKGKCGLKLLQYMAAGLPTLASPVGVNADIVVHGTTGFLADSDQEWQNALEMLIRNPQLRAAMGYAGRARCVQLYSIERWFPTFLKILEITRGFNQ